MSNIEETFLGACYLGDELVHCAYEEAGCNGLEFRSDRTQVEPTRCDANHRQLIGLCTEDTVCTTDASNCRDPTKFVPEMPYCNIEYNTYPGRTSPGFALWGTCTVDGVSTCVWSEADCPNTTNAVFATPAEVGYSHHVEQLCTCDNTKVGACVNGGIYTCAVSESSCDSSSAFRTWQEIEGVVDCRLCNGFEKVERPDLTFVPFSYKRTPSKESNSAGAIIGAALGAAVGGLLVAVIFVCCYSGRRNSGKESSFEGSQMSQVA